MFGEKFKRKYALSDRGVKNVKKGTFWTVIVNLIAMVGAGILYMLMQGLVNTLTNGDELPNTWIFIGIVVAFIILSFITHIQQYGNTYSAVYGEIKDIRIGIAEKMRKLPLGYFGKRDLADLTETIMGDV
ncbi:MAG: ABC transporter ATP-binding protein, partial [Eubacterium sp.]|nr:ABC transporter ATP-binding protein [Eubacterium sp.]